MRDLYARFVLWLIRPALDLQAKRSRASPEELAAALRQLERPLSPSLLSEIARSEQYEPCS